MIIGGNGQPPREVRGLTEAQRRDISVYLQGMVYGWCESKGTELFAAHNLVGGVNKNWSGTPLQCVYEKQTTGEETAYDIAAQEVGRLLKQVIIDDQRKFTCVHEGRNTNHYAWDGKYPVQSMNRGEKMTPDQLANKLKNMYENAPGEQTTMIHLFGLLYASELEKYTVSEMQQMAEEATGKKSYGTELSKMKRLAKYVEVKRPYREGFI